MRPTRMTVTILTLSLGVAAFWPDAVWATHAASASGEIEGRPASVFRRICLAGTSAGQLCKQDSECPGSACATRNVFNLTVAVRFNASNTQLATIQALLTSMSSVLMDVSDGQVEVGTVTIHNNAMSTSNADFVVHPATNDTGYQALSGHYRTGGFMEVSINRITNTVTQGATMAHEFTHLIFDARDEYESRAAGCGAVIGAATCPVAASGVPRGLMDANGSEFCWGQGNSADLTDISGGDHDPTNVTEQSVCRSNRSVWDQVVWSWPSTILQPTGAPNAGSNGVATTPPNYVITNNAVRVVLVLDRSGSMSSEIPSRMQRLQVAANDFIATAENGSEVGIVSYSNSAANDVAIAALTNDRSTWTNAIDGFSTGGWTNIGDGLQKAKDMIVAAGGVTANTYVVLMTDGLNNRPEPQETADGDLQDKVDDLLASGIPVYVTCTGGDLGLQSQCAEIATGTGGFTADSSDVWDLSENFVDFHERITGHEPIDSVYGNFAEPSSKTFFVDEGSQSASFSLLWKELGTKASMHLIDPNGTSLGSNPIPQGAYIRVANPVPGDWTMRVDPSGQSNSDYVARAHVHNRINSFVLSLRKSSIKRNEEMYVYAVARSMGGVVTASGTPLVAEVTLPDGTIQPLELRDEGRDAAGHGDDVSRDGIYTGVLTNTSQTGAYGFRVVANVEEWRSGEDDHHHEGRGVSRRFTREGRLSGAVYDPTGKETTFEDDPGEHEEGVPGKPDIKDVTRLVWVVIVLLVVLILMTWFCCARKEHRSPPVE